jgi:hypothetical protein
MSYATDILKDAMFWSRLEFAACGWLASTPAGSVCRKYWVDGFAPDDFRRTNAGAEISGRVWLMDHGRKGSVACDKNGASRFFTCVPWRVVNRGREAFEIEQIEIDEEGGLVTVVFCATLKKPNRVAGGI